MTDLRETPAGHPRPLLFTTVSGLGGGSTGAIDDGGAERDDSDQSGPPPARAEWAGPGARAAVHVGSLVDAATGAVVEDDISLLVGITGA